MWWMPLIQAAGSAVAANQANQGAQAAADATTGANKDAINLQRDIYKDQVNRSEPWRQTGLAALNFQNLWTGLPQVSDMPQSGSANGFGWSPSAGVSPTQPKYEGMYSPSEQLTGRHPSLYRGIMNGDLSGALDPLGLISQPKGDNWTSLWEQAPEGMDYQGYYAANPDVAAEWQKPDVQKLFKGDADSYANWHYNKFGKGEGRTINPIGNTQSNMPVGGAQAEGTGATGGASTTPDLWSTIKNNPLYVAATQGFLGIDKPQVEGAFSTAGQTLSGAKEKALFDRGTARSYSALGDIWNQYAGLSGSGQTAVTQQNNNAGQFGTNAGNIIMQNGQVAGDLATTKNANWLKAADSAAKAAGSAGWFGT